MLCQIEDIEDEENSNEIAYNKKGEKKQEEKDKIVKTQKCKNKPRKPSRLRNKGCNSRKKDVFLKIEK